MSVPLAVPLVTGDADGAGSRKRRKQQQSENAKAHAALNIFPVQMGMHRENRQRLAERVRGDVTVAESWKTGQDSDPGGGILVLQGGGAEERHETDHEKFFRQESTFAYLFGVKEPDCFGLVHIRSGKSVLFIPRLPEDYAVWMGYIRSPSSFQEEYEVDEVHYSDEFAAYLEGVQPGCVYVQHGLNADSGNWAKEASCMSESKWRTDNGILYDHIVECRVIKTEKELDLMRHVNRVSSEAHMAVMKNLQPGMMEFQLESIFRHWGLFTGGCRECSYSSICGSGDNGAILHYGHAGAPNDKTIRDGEMMLLDMGAEFHCYTSDITCSYPANGVFTSDQRIIYEAVLAAQLGVLDAMRPGVSNVDMHRLSYEIICTKLKEGDILKGEVEDMMAVNIGAVFMPHGLGHFMGLDTHDVGGRPEGHDKQTLDGFKSLRCCRVLQPGMVLTVEPGVYFNNYCLDRALANPKQACFFNKDVLQRFRGFGGVRLEDDVIVTEDGIENMTKCPRSVSDIEAVMRGEITKIEQLNNKH
jgi:Xaa-Pro dipeptidase